MYPRDILAAILTSVILISVFTFVSVAAWADRAGGSAKRSTAARF